jgi:hypothetical protein
MYSCFNTLGGIRNACGALNFEIPLPYDNPGAKAVTFLIISHSDLNSGCRALVIDMNLGVFLATDYARSTAIDTFEQKTTPSIMVPSRGEFWLDCNMGNDTRVSWIRFNE